MLKYVNEQLRNYIPEQDLQEGILKPYAVPSNMRKTSTIYILCKIFVGRKSQKLSNNK